MKQILKVGTVALCSYTCVTIILLTFYQIQAQLSPFFTFWNCNS